MASRQTDLFLVGYHWFVRHDEQSLVRGNGFCYSLHGSGQQPIALTSSISNPRAIGMPVSAASWGVAVTCVEGLISVVPAKYEAMRLPPQSVSTAQPRTEPAHSGAGRRVFVGGKPSSAVTASIVCGCGILTTPSNSFRDNSEMTQSRKMPQIAAGNAGSVRPIIFSHPVASELQVQKARRTHHVKKGTLFDDESNVVGKGTEPNLLIAKAAGLGAFIPNGDAASLQVVQIQEWVAVPERRKSLAW
jgi:hypothetical protein